MKKMKTVLWIALILTAIIPIYAQQYDIESDFEVTKLDNGKSIAIKKYLGSKQNVNIPPTIQGLPVTEIWKNAFYNCENITSVTIPDGVTSLSGFYGCKSLESINIPNSVTSIKGSAFYFCSSLKNITIPDSVTSIGAYAFYECKKLTSVTIPDSVTSIEDDAFSLCDKLTAINVDSVNTAYSSQGGVLYNKNKTILICYPAGKTGSNFTIPKSVTSIDGNAFSGCTSLKNITIPQSVTSIGNSAFYQCTSLKSITIPKGVTSIEGGTFYQCTSLESIKIPDSVTSIGNGAFSQCTSLKSITIPKSLTSIEDLVLFIGEGPFYGCDKLTAINVDSDNTVYSSQGGVFYDKNKTVLFYYPAGKTGSKFTIPNSVTIIWPMAFRGCTSLTSINIPNSFINIFAYAFYGSGLTSVTIPESVASIMAGAFYDCSRLTSVTFQGTISSDNFGSEDYVTNKSFASPFLGDLRDKYLSGSKGTYTTTAPVDENSVWSKK